MFAIIFMFEFNYPLRKDFPTYLLSVLFAEAIRSGDDDVLDSRGGVILFQASLSERRLLCNQDLLSLSLTIIYHGDASKLCTPPNSSEGV